MMSIAIQATLVYGAVVATKSTAKPLAVVDVDSILLTPPSLTPAREPDRPAEDRVVPTTHIRRAFQTVEAVIEIPEDIPAIDLDRPFDPADFTGRGPEGGITSGMGDSTPGIESRVILNAELEDRPRLISIAAPIYPPVLESAGITGRVVLEFVIDTAGRVIPASARVISSTNPAFEGPALDAFRTAIFTPGTLRGTPVHVLVRQSVSFTR